MFERVEPEVFRSCSGDEGNDGSSANLMYSGGSRT